MDTTELAVAVATILGGLAVLAAVVRWLAKTIKDVRAARQRRSKQEQSTALLDISVNRREPVDLQELKSLSYRLFIGARDGEQFEFLFEIEELSIARSQLKPQEEISTPEEARYQSALRIYMNRFLEVTNILQKGFAILHTPQVADRLISFYDEEYWWYLLYQYILLSLDRLGKERREFRGRDETKLDIFSPKKNYSFGIHLSEAELNSLLSELGVANVREFGARKFWLHELGRELTRKYVFPKMLYTFVLAREGLIQYRLETDKFIDYLSTSDWRFGLG